MEPQTVDTLWLLLCSGLVLLMQPGFMCLESGLTRSKNSIDVAIKNLADFGLSLMLFWAFGFAVMHGISWGGWLGSGDLFPALRTSNGWTIAFFVFQAMFCGTAVTIVSGAVAERMRFRGYLMITIVLSGLLYTFFGHWAWNGLASGSYEGWLGARGFRDFAGATVVHGVGGWVALAAVLVLGPRHGRFPQEAPDPDETRREIRGHNLPLAILGVSLLWLGWLGFNGGGALGWSDQVPLLVANTMVAAAAGLTTALVVGFLRQSRPDVRLTMSGALAGLVAITGGCHVVDARGAAMIGVIGALVMVMATRLLDRLRIDDAVGAIPVHVAAGAWGTLAVGVFGDLDRLATGLGRGEQIAVQGLGVGVACAWALGGGYVLLRALNLWAPLRVTAEEEARGLNIVEHGATTELFDLVTAIERQASAGDIDLKVGIDSESDMGQIAEQYDRVIGALQRAMQDLRDSSERYRRTIDHALDAIVTVDDKGVIVGWNPQAEAIFGWSEDEALGEDVFELVTPVSVRETTRVGLLSFLTVGGTSSYVDQRIEVSGIDRDGREFPLEVTFTMASYGGKMEFTLFLQDITERQRARKALERAKEAAEDATRAKSAFLANMSHEIRTPMNGILGMTELLLDGELSDQQRGYLEMVKTSADSLLRLLADILDFSKIEAGKVDIQASEFTLRDHLSRILRSLMLAADDKGLDLSWKVDPGVPDVLIGDPTRLGQILINLLSNAIKFTDKGSVRVVVDLESIHEKHAVVAFAVSDTGQGIERDKHTLVFKVFEQADSSKTRKFGGTGLGLAISKRLVESMGGRIWVDSEPGRGSVFHFTIRFQRTGTPISAEIDRPPLLEPLTRSPSAPTPRALVVEDNRINQAVATGMLERWGIVTVAVASGKEALAVLDQKTFDVVLLDTHMPDMDGFAVTRAIRKREQASNIRLPIIATTADVMPGDRERCLASGMDSYVAKPIVKRELAAALAEVGVAILRPNKPIAERSDTSEDTAVGEEATVFDRQMLMRQADGRLDRAQRLAGIFLDDDAPRQLAELHAALATQDTARLAATAHAFKGAAGELGATVMGDAARRLEQAAREGDFEQIPEKCETLEAEIQNLIANLEAFQQE